jgi:hypothetical protein
MMSMLLIIAVGALFQLILPWWSAILPALVIGGWLGNSRGAALRNGGLGIGLLWLGYAWYLSANNDGILVDRIAAMLQVPAGGWVLAITFVIGGVTGMLSAWVGYEVHEWIDS